jgi:para-nitrobenzyl esterase
VRSAPSKAFRTLHHLYWFSHAPPHPRAATLGAYHTSEIPYAFNNLLRTDWNYTAIDRRIADSMSSYWVNFATTGEPNGAGVPTWPPYNVAEEPYMELADAPVSKKFLRKAALEFFDRALARSGGTSQQ